MKRMITMRHLTTAPISLLCLSLLVPTTLTRCGGSASELGDPGGFGTETGNPPVIKKESLHLEVAPGGMRLIGTPGAVTPGAEVRVTNQGTGATARGTAAPDGSVDVLIAGNASDVYEVTVARGGSEVKVTLAGDDLPDDLSTLSCDALLNAASTIADDAYATADSSCSEDSDCVEATWFVDTCVSACGTSILSVVGQEAAIAESNQRTAATCGELDRRGCPIPDVDCDGSPFRVLRCEAGQCVGRELDQLSCDELQLAVSTRLSEARDAASRDCQADNDCRLATINVVSCAPFLCDVQDALRSDAVDPFVSRVQSIGRDVCGRAAACQLPEQQPACNPPPERTAAECVEGVCTVVAEE
jgi:hypothetical protein